jgi:hypothetical protein
MTASLDHNNHADSHAATLDARLPSGRSCRLSAWVSIALGIVIFLAGGICGAAALRLAARPKPLTNLKEIPERVAVKIQQDLGLNDTQRAGIERIIRGHQPELHRLRVQIMPEMRHEFAQMVDEISLLLTPDQAARFQAEAQRRLDVHFPPEEATTAEPAPNPSSTN